MHGPVRLPTSTSDRVAPHNIELEQALLGAIFVNDEAFHRVADFLEPGHFFEPIHSRIFEVCRDLLAAGKTATPITVNSFLPGDFRIAGMTVSQYLARLAAEATTVINAADYGQEIRALAARRDIIQIGEDLIDASYQMSADAAPRAVATGGIERLDEIVAIGARDHSNRVEIGKAADETMDRLADMLQNPHSRTGVRFGLCDVDRMTSCLQSGHLVVMAARPGMGKSGLAISCSLRAAKAGHRILFASLEMTGASLASRAMSDLCYDRWRRIPYFDIDNGRVSDEDYDRIEDARRLLHTMPIVIEQQAALSVAQLAARARKLQQSLERKQQKLDGVVVDHIHIMRPSDRYKGRRVDEVSEISAGLKALAKELGVPVLALAQLSREVEHRDVKRPQLSDLRDSGSIEQDADAVIFLFREESL
jgi:replicative DNA helicase